MIKNRHILNEFYRKLDAEKNLSYKQALAIYEMLHNEAMSLGTPTVTSNVSSMPEVAGDAAVLIDPKNVDELYQGMKRLIDDTHLYNALKNKSILQAGKFTWKKTAMKTINVYESILQPDDRVLKGDSSNP